MARFARWTLTPLALAAMAVPALADTVTFPGKSPEKVAPGRVLAGPAVVKSDDGKDTITLRKGAMLEFRGTDTDPQGRKASTYFLRSGAVDADVSFFTRVATPSFWAFPSTDGTRASFYVETFGVNVGYARAAQGSGLVRLLVDPDTGGSYSMEVDLNANQGVTLERNVGGDKQHIRYTTDPHNDFRRGRVRVIYPLATGLLIDLYVPKATSGAIRPKPGVTGKTEVENNVTSWKSGKILIVTLLGGGKTGEGEIGPGVVATIDNASGRIEIGFVKVEFATLKAAVSLTSEFESLATSQITKVK